jgi:hypothetical protein
MLTMPLAVRQPVMYSSGLAGKGSLPAKCFAAISHADTALKMS